MKPVYFISDAHLGSLAIQSPRTQERRLVNFLDAIKHKAQAVYMLGDMFDFWLEYRTVVPRGYTRFLGKISELTDMGVEVHYFTGNHDLWTTDYLQKECGVILHRCASDTVEIYGKVFYLGHGDGIGEIEKGFRFLRGCFYNGFCQSLLRAIHPRWGMALGLNWAKHSRLKHEKEGGERPYEGEEKEGLISFAKAYLKTHNNINFFIFGHRHIEVDLLIAKDSRVMIIGDWISQFTFAKFDGETMIMDNFIEGETEL